MRIGNYRHRVTIQQVTETQNNYGELIKSWSTFATVWAAVEPLRAQELWQGKEQQSRMDTRIRIRYMAGITPKMRVIFGEHTYEIVSVIDEEMRHRKIQLMCWEIVDV